MRILIMALLATVLVAQPALAARWALVNGGVIKKIYTGGESPHIDGKVRGLWIFKPAYAEMASSVGLHKIVVDAKPVFNKLTQRLRANRLSVGSVYANETWTVLPLSLRAKRAASRRKRRSEYQSRIGGNITIIIAILNQIQKMKDDGIAMTTEMDAILTRFEATNSAHPIP